MRDADGYYWFVGRADDVIKSSGHLIGPFEVESALMEHPAVAEAGVIGKPDPMAGEIVKAFVALKPGFAPSEALRRELLGHRPQAAGRGGGAEGDRLPAEPAAGPAAARSCAACSRRASSACRKATLSTLESDDAMTRHRLHLDRAHRASICCAQMLRIRRFEEKCAELYSARRSAASCISTIGEEAVAVGVIAGAGAATTRSSPPTASTATRWRAASRMDAIMAEMYGKLEGCSRGRGGSMHLFDARRRFYGGNAIVGGGLPLAVGTGAGRQDARRATASPPASSATARWPRASSTKA